MNAAETIEAVREATATELDRLGSDKLLLAVTDATLEPEAVRGAAVTRERGLAAALEQWATDETDGEVADAFAAAAADATERADRVDAVPGESDALSAHLSATDETASRIGAGLVAAPLVADRFYLQVVNFFVNEADERSADRFRDLRTEASSLERATDLLSALSQSERETARDAAVEGIETAYADYADTLESMGLDPRPIC